MWRPALLAEGPVMQGDYAAKGWAGDACFWLDTLLFDALGRQVSGVVSGTATTLATDGLL